MHDIKRIGNDPEAFDIALKRRGLPPASAQILEMDKKRRTLIQALEQLQAERNQKSRAIGQAKASKDEAEASALMAEVTSLKGKIHDNEAAKRDIETELEASLAALPNCVDESVPDGTDEHENQIVSKSGTPPRFDFPVKSHDELGVGLGLMDFETASRLSGARFVVLTGALARLERALAQFMLDRHTDVHGYKEVSPPTLVKTHTMFGTAQLPKFADDQFQTSDDLWLIPTAEVPLTNLVREQILKRENLPHRFTAYTQCYRREAGSAGRDTRGMIRQHQFAKVEMVSITTPENGEAELERMVKCAQTILNDLELCYQTVALCAGDLGFAATKTYDLEVWLPSQNTYREISSCSLCRDFQARRMNTRYRTDDGSTAFVHTLNGSGVAVGRALLALMENHQNSDGSIRIPTSLRPYMNGLDVIAAPHIDQRKHT